MKKIFPVLFLGSLLVACAAPQTRSLRATPAAPEQAAVEVDNVPFFANQDYQGGPAALAALLNFTGKPVPPEQVAKELAGIEGGATLDVDLATVARRQGRLIYPIAPQLEAVLAALQQGYPVLVMQNRGLRIFPLRRFAVVVGADRTLERFLLRTSQNERLEIPFDAFERSWARADYWGMLVLDPSTVPDSLDPRMVVRELALLEQEGALAEAQQGFNEAVLNWPEQKPAWLGLASTSMKLGQMERAESTLRELVRRAPHYGAGLNNLADLLLKTGRPMEALPLAEQAVAVLDVPTTRATLQAAHQAVAPLQSQALPPIAGEKPVEVIEKPAEKSKKAIVHHRKKSGRATAKKSSGKSATPAQEASTTVEAAPVR